MTVVACIGGLTLDHVRTASATSGPYPGGNALYAAVGVALAGGTPLMQAVIGEDFPEQIMDRLVSAGLDVSGVERVRGPSFHVLLDVASDPRQISYLPTSGRNDVLDPTPPRRLNASIDAAHIAAIPTQSQQAWANRLQADRVPFTLDTVFIRNEIEPCAEDLLSLAATATAFMPSVEDLSALWPGISPHRGAADLSRRTQRTVVVTCGAAGAVGCDQGTLVTMPAYPVESVDSTGAGDAYCGAFASAVSQGHGLVDAMALASACASVVVESFGAEHGLNEEARRLATSRAAELKKLASEEPRHAAEF